MRLVLLGAPGCGKGTHSAWMIQALGVPQISTGDILRDAVAAGTDLGREAQRTMESGALVPDPVILGLMRERLAAEDAAAGFILDGFPRTIAQAEGLTAILTAQGAALDAVLKLEVARAELIKRLTSRRVCPQCKAVYNLDFRPPQKPGICDRCGAEVIQRADDQEATVVERLAVYEEQTAPLVTHYEAQGHLVVIDGNDGYDRTRAQIEARLGVAR